MFKNKLMVMFSLVFAAISFSANAQSWYPSSEQVTTIEAGVNYVLVPDHAWQSGGVYISGLTDQTTVTDDCIYQFEAVGTDSKGFPTYRIKQMSTGLYYATPTSVNTAQTASKASAGVFTIKPSVALVTSYEEYDNIDWSTVDFSTYVWVMDEYYYHENTFVICVADYDASGDTSYLRLCYYGGINNGLYDGCNTWSFYTVEQGGAYDDLNNYVETNFPNGFSASDYPSGTDMGYVPQDKVDALKTAYEEARAILDGTLQENEVYKAALTKLQNALTDLQASVILPEAPAYYVLTNAESSRGDGTASMYDTGTSLAWANYTMPEGNFTAADAQMVWQLIPAEDGDGYYLQNYVTKRYAGSQSSLNTAVPSTEEKSQIYDIKYMTIGQPVFAISSRGQNGNYPALHAQGDANNIVIWTETASASGWKFTNVDAALLADADAGIEQLLLNNKLQDIYEDAVEVSKEGIVVKSAASADGLFTDLGLVTDASQISTNKQETSVSADISNLLDNNQLTYFVSTWSEANTTGEYAHIDVDLGKACQYVVFKYSSAFWTGEYRPTEAKFYGTNDEGDTKIWTLVGTGDLTYDYKSNDTYYYAGYSDFTGIYSLVMTEPYRYIRTEVVGTIDGSTYNSNLYFYLSEFHVYEGSYDAENSPLEGMDATIRAEFTSALAAAKATLAAGNATNEDIEKLQTAYDNYVAAMPDPDEASDILAEAQELLSTAVEGEFVGYFEEGSKAELETAINAASPNIKTVMTLKEINDVKTQLQTAIDAFIARLNVPEDGVYYIQSSSSSTASGTPVNNYLYASDNDNSRIGWGGYSSSTGADEYLSARLNYMWRLTNYDDGTFTLRNLATGTYLNDVSNVNYYITMSQTPEYHKYYTAKKEGLLALMLGDNLFASALQSYGTVVSVSSVSAADNAAFSFVSASPEGSYYMDIAAKDKVQILSLPFAIMGDCAEAALYKVKGVKTTDEGSEMVFEAYTSNDVIPAATAFLMVNEDENAGAYLYPNDDDVLELNYDFEPKTQNGLVATLQSTDLVASCGVLFYTGATYNILATEDGDATDANSGYFDGNTTTTTEDGAYSIPIDGLITSVDVVKTFGTAEKVDVYTLSGVKVRANVKAAEATESLPKGLYIVGNKKVIVK